MREDFAPNKKNKINIVASHSCTKRNSIQLKKINIMIKIPQGKKAAVLAALYNNSRVQGMGFLQAEPGNMSEDEAQKLLDSGTTYFDYLKGRVMKIDLSADEFSPRLYDRDLGDGAAQRAVESIQ